MIPLRDSIPTQRTAYVTIALIVANVLVFLWQVSLGPGFEYAVWAFGVRPIELLTDVRLRPPTPGSEWITPLTSMFLHGGWLHLGGNMLFLWVFGNNIEDSLGPLRFLIFYALVGLGGTVAQVAQDPFEALPMVGASGAIAGIMGAYLLLYPRARILTLVPIFFFIRIVELPAALFLGVWMLIQLLSAPSGGGTAWFAHIGGFVTGLVLVKAFLPASTKR